MTIGFEIVAWVNTILGLMALVGYIFRIVIGAKKNCFKRSQVLLFLYAISAFSISLIFFLLATGWYLAFADNYYNFSIMYIRPFFTFLLVTFIISNATHPEYRAGITKAKESAWQTFRRLIGRK